MTTFDFVISVTLGASFGRILTAKEVGIAEMMVTFSVLIGFQYLVTWLRPRSSLIRDWVDPAPALLFYQGRPLAEAMARERVTELALEISVRKQGYGSLAEVAAVVLEPDGRFAVIPAESAGDRSLLEGLRPPPPTG